jgi:hypothetical protein
MNGRTSTLVVAAFIAAALPAGAEFRQIDLSIYGMD